MNEWVSFKSDLAQCLLLSLPRSHCSVTLHLPRALCLSAALPPLTDLSDLLFSLHSSTSVCV